MALKGALENELLGHIVGSSARCSIDLRRQFGGGGWSNSIYEISCGRKT